MLDIKQPVRTAAERADHKAKLNEIFAKVGSKGKIDARGLKQLNDNRVEVAETIVELIKDDLTVVDPTPFLVDRRSQGFVDKNLFQRLDGTLKVVNRAYGSKPLSQRLTASEFTFNTSMKEIAVEVPLEEIVGGRITASQVVEAMAYAIGRYKASLVLDAIDAAVTAVADHTGESGYVLRYTSLTQANLEKAIDGMRDDAESPTIFSRHIASVPIRAFSGWSEVQKGEFLARGEVGTFLGAPVVTLIDKWSRLLGGHQISKDRMWVAAGGEKGAWLVEKDVTFLNWAVIDERTATFATGIRLEDGVFVHDAHKYRVIEA